MLRTSAQAVSYVKGREEDHYSNELQLSSLEITNTLTQIFACSIDKHFLLNTINITKIKAKFEDLLISVIRRSKLNTLSNVTPMSLAYLDRRIMDTSLSATGGNCRVGLNWDLLIKSSVLSPVNF